MNRIFMASVLGFFNILILIMIEIAYPNNVNMYFVIFGLVVCETAGLISIVLPNKQTALTEEKSQ